MAARRIIHDCDPGQDDAIALLLELASPEELELLAVTTVAAAVGGMLHYGREHAGKAGQSGPPIHDVLVPAYLLRPDLFRVRPAYLRVTAWGQTGTSGRMYRWLDFRMRRWIGTT